MNKNFERFEFYFGLYNLNNKRSQLKKVLFKKEII
jgi:hypothetical protein